MRSNRSTSPLRSCADTRERPASGCGSIAAGTNPSGAHEWVSERRPPRTARGACPGRSRAIDQRSSAPSISASTPSEAQTREPRRRDPRADSRNPVESPTAAWPLQSREPRSRYLVHCSTRGKAPYRAAHAPPCSELCLPFLGRSRPGMEMAQGILVTLRITTVDEGMTRRIRVLQVASPRRRLTSCGARYRGRTRSRLASISRSCDRPTRSAWPHFALRRCLDLRGLLPHLAWRVDAEDAP